MKVLIIYDSAFGNTEKIAQAMGVALDCDTCHITMGVSAAN